MNPRILEHLKDCRNLPTLPAVATRIIGLCQRNDCSLSELGQVISQDPALSAKVLRMVNSAYYGFAREISTIEHAVAILGVEAVQSVALTFSLLLGLRHGEGDGSALNLFWRRSLISAVTARCLGQRMHRRDQDVLFLAALLQDIGVLALREACPKQYPVLLAQSRGEHWVLQGLENAELGTDHAAVSAWLVNNWQLPAVYESAIKASHDPDCVEVDPGYREPARIVAVSGLIADIWLMKDPFSSAQCAMGHASQLLGLEEEDVRELLKQVGQALPELSVLYEMDLGDADTFQKVLEPLEEAGATPGSQEDSRGLHGVALDCSVEWNDQKASGQISHLAYAGAVIKRSDPVPAEGVTVIVTLVTGQGSVRMKASITWRAVHEGDQLRDRLGGGSFGVRFAEPVEELKAKLDPVFAGLSGQSPARLSA